MVPTVYLAKVDDKGRLRLPSDLRAQMQCFPVWCALKEKETVLLAHDLSSAQRVEIDSTGRLVLPGGGGSQFANTEVHVVAGARCISIMSVRDIEKNIGRLERYPFFFNESA